MRRRLLQHVQAVSKCFIGFSGGQAALSQQDVQEHVDLLTQVYTRSRSVDAARNSNGERYARA
eukprot:15435671-Alexandrium_andersonii.AAC.1